MADLSKSKLLDVKYGDARVITFVSITTKGTGHTVLSKHGGGKYVPKKFIIDGKEYIVGRVQESALVSAIKGHNKLMMEDASGKQRPLGHLEKTMDYKEGKGYNQGDIAEGIFGAAITARFINKNRDISASDVENVLMKLNRNPKQQINYKSANANPAILDDIEFVLGLAKNNMEALADRNIRALPETKKLVEASVKYANATYVKKWANLVYENNIYNRVQVLSDGLSDQTGTKVDVRVKLSNHDKELKDIDINVSLKAGDVKQFGQISGSGFDVQIKLWKQLFGMDVSRQRSTYEAFLKKSETKKAVQFIYKHVATEVAKKFSEDDKDTLKAFASAIQWHATRDEKHVQLVQLKSGMAKVYTFDNLEKAFDKLGPFKAEIRVGSSGLPQMDLFARGINTGILRVRVKIETKPNGELYFRNILEKLNGLGELIAEYAGENE